MVKRIITFLLTFSGVVCHAYYPTVSNFEKSSYKGGGQNWCITQDINGIMWFANSGLLEYDGKDWGMTNTRNMSSVRSLFYDNIDGRLYIGATNELGYIHIDDNGKREYVQMLDGKDVVLDEIWAIHKAAGKIWFRDNSRLYRCDGQTIRKFDFGDNITCSAEIDDTIYVTVNGKGVLKQAGDDTFSPVSGTTILKDKKVCAIFKEAGHGLIFVTEHHGAYSIKDTGLSRLRKGIYADLEGENIFCAASDGRYISFGTVSSGVYIHDTRDRNTIHLNTSNGLQNNTVLSMFYDMDGNLWLGLDKGIDLVHLSSPELRIFGNPDDFGTGYASEIYDGKLWLGTNQGLFTVRLDDGENDGIDSETRQFERVKGQVWDLTVYDGRLFCCHDNGINIIQGQTSSHISLDGVWKVEPLESHPEYLLGSTYNRMFLLKKTGSDWKFSSWIEGFEEASKTFEEDSDGKIWFSHWMKGLFLLDLDVKESRIRHSAYYSKGNGLPEDWGNVPIELDGEIIFTTADGLYRYDRNSDRMHYMQDLNKELGNPAGSAHVHFSEHGHAYISNGDTQSIRYRDSSGNMVLDTLSLLYLTNKRPIGFEDIRSLSENSMMINTEDGFSIIRIDMLGSSKSEKEKRILIKEIYTRGPKGETLAYSSWCKNTADKSLKLKYQDNTLIFNTVYPEFKNGNHVLYRYRLDNYDEEWTTTTESGIKEYTKLPHGRYTLRVRAYDNITGRPEEDSIKIIISAPWYHSIYAYITYVLIGIIGIAVLYRLFQSISLKRARKIAMKKEEEMRHEQMRLDLEHKADDLAESTMNLIRKNEILLKIDSDLEKVVDYIAEDRNKSLKLVGNIRKEIRENIQHDNVWHKFEENFDVVYADYLKRLSTQFPNLTLADKKMCAYLKMDLSSKEIAPLLNITVRSVEMTRYRLRKKLGLGHEANLTEFLQNF